MITKKDVEYVANLARLELTEEEKEKFTKQLGAILEYMDQLKKLNTENIKPTAHVLELKNVWREDELKPCSYSDSLLNNAPEKELDFFKVKKVIE